MKIPLALIGLGLTTTAFADTLPFDLIIRGNGLNIQKSLTISDPGEKGDTVDVHFKNAGGDKFRLTMRYKQLPPNRSYPRNLDITLRDGDGNKLGYLFWANNGTQSLKDMGHIGMITRHGKQIFDTRFSFKPTSGTLRVSELKEERFVQETLVPSLNLQMIRPVTLPETQPGTLSQSFDLDAHPYAVNYTIKDQPEGGVRFEHSLHAKKGARHQLLEQIYFHADSLKTLRSALYASKYFHETDGTFKLVFYPTMGQTLPPMP